MLLTTQRKRLRGQIYIESEETELYMGGKTDVPTRRKSLKTLQDKTEFARLAN